MRLIDIDALPDDCAWCRDALVEAINDAPTAPTVDAVEVIRCENCAKRDDDEWEDIEKVYWCDIMDGCVDADDYCSYAERRAR